MTFINYVYFQHVQDILESWSSHINNSSLILYRAVGPYNRTVLFGGKNPPLDKNDLRLRPLPFPTRRATFSEVKRVYEVLSSMDIYGTILIILYFKYLSVLILYINIVCCRFCI